ncbi:hypothetical protein FQZ97_1242100 [compost metagenome]
MFKLGVYVGDTLMGQGSGPSKQMAQQVAAKAALAAYAKRQQPSVRQIEPLKTD